MLTYFQSIIMGLLQGITELFPISSLGHSVIFPTLFGWTNLVKAQSDPESFFLAFLVGLHLATALALILFYRKDWIKIILAFFTSLKKRKAEAPDEKLAWLLIAATIPTGLLALIFEHPLRTLFAKPIYAVFFLILNGIILLGTELFLGRKTKRLKTVKTLETISYKNAGLIGLFQTTALFAGISRSGVTLVGGLFSGLEHKSAARFSFLLATPIILLAGLYKIPDLLGSNGNGVRMQILVGSMVAFVAAYLSVKFLDKYFEKRKTTPYAIYCLIIGIGLAIKFIVFP